MLYLSQKSVLGLELLGEVHGAVDEAEPGGLATPEVGLEAKGEDPVGVQLDFFTQLLTDLRMKSWLINLEDLITRGVKVKIYGFIT